MIWCVKSDGSYINHTLAQDVIAHTHFGNTVANVKKANNPNLSPIGNKFGLDLSDVRARTCSATNEIIDPYNHLKSI